MALPSTNTNGIQILAPGSVPAPAVGYVTYFFNSSDGNKLYYKSSDNSITLASEFPSGFPDCACTILCGFSSTWNKALLSGTITPVEYSGLLTAGVQVNVAGTIYSVSNIQ